MEPKSYLYIRQTRGQWYWRIKTRNHKSIAIGGEGYHNERDIIKILPLIQAAIAVKLEQVKTQAGTRKTSTQPARNG